MDRQKCARWNVSAADVQAVIQSAVGGKAVTQMQEGGKTFDVTVRWPEQLRDSGDVILRIPVPVTGNQVIVTSGYAHSTPLTPKAGFYPGYPLLVSAVYQPLRALAGWLAPGYRFPAPPTMGGPFGMDPLLDASMLVVANVSLVVALVVLWRLYEPELGATATVIGCGLLLTAPNSLFLSAGFSESSFIAATAAAFLLAQRGRWVAADHCRTMLRHA